jgi:hypothetical protein
MNTYEHIIHKQNGLIIRASNLSAARQTGEERIIQVALKTIYFNCSMTKQEKNLMMVMEAN